MSFQALVEANYGDNLTGGYEFVFETEGFKVYRRPAAGSIAEATLFEYKAVGVIKSVKADIAYRVYMDHELRRKYDSNQGDTKITNQAVNDLEHQTLEAAGTTREGQACKVSILSESTICKQSVEWIVKYPWPMSNRLYSFDRDTRLLKVKSAGGADFTVDVYAVTCASNVKHSKTPLLKESPSITERYPNHVVIEDYHQNWLFYSDKESAGTNVVMTYFENSGAGLPVSVMQWALQRGIPGFIKSLISACTDFQNQKDKEQQKLKLKSESSKISITKTAEA